MFIRNKEDFKCEKCGQLIKGNGYTNHCSNCLWSKHVDNDPGDRKADCAGMMDPIGLIIDSKGNKIMHKCIKCGFTRKNRVSELDNSDTLIEVSKKQFVC